METSHSLRTSSRPLKCDGVGNFRILLVGNAGAGKSTTAKKLSRILQLPAIHLDEVYYRPKWQGIPEDEFCSIVRSFMRENPGWIIDGDYDSVADFVHAAATCILWLDPPLVLSFPRLVLRTFLQLIGVVPPFSPGCNDSLWGLIFWEGKSVLWWCLTHHTLLKERYTSEMQQPGDDQGGKWIRLSGWVGEVNTWLKQIESSAKAQ